MSDDEYIDYNLPAPGIPPVCPDCGEMRGVCRCAEFEAPYFWIPNDDDDDWDDDWDDGWMYDGIDECPHCASLNTERIDTISDDPVIWIVQCDSCGDTFEALIPPHDEP